jgi:hypothetical protein
MPDPGQKLLDLTHNQTGLAEPDRMIGSRQFDQLRVGKR